VTAGPAATPGPSAPSASTAPASTPGAAYAAGVAAGRWNRDPGQVAALQQLDRIHRELLAQARQGWWQRLRARVGGPAAAPRGLYLWGEVGRGKTLLVDLFFEQLRAHLPSLCSRRVHFHRFMGEVHAQLRALGERSDPLDQVAAAVAAEARVLCLDEFFVTDIGDAMLLARLLEGLFARGVVLVTTSNTEPAQLYRDGLQRARFLPAIALLQRHCVVHRLEGALDYRLRSLRQSPVYQQPLGSAADAALAAVFARLAAERAPEDGALDINGRSIATVQRSDGIAWFTFAALCEGPRAVADYIEIARDFHTVLLQDVPRFDARSDDAARRFVHLVDELYDRNVNLVLSAAAPPHALYAGERLRGAFERTASRLVEMQSEQYLARPHRP